MNDNQMDSILSSGLYIGSRGDWMMFKGPKKVTALARGSQRRLSVEVRKSCLSELFATIDEEAFRKQVAERLMEDPREGKYCVAHGGSQGTEKYNRTFNLRCPRCLGENSK